MNKILGMMIPYIILVCVGFMESALIAKTLTAFVVGLLIGIEFLNLKKAEGTVLMKLGKIFTIFIFNNSNSHSNNIYNSHVSKPNIGHDKEQ